MKKILSLIMAMLMLTGCDGFADKDNIINLLSSPKLSQRESRIVTCITESLEQDIILKYPKQGSNISPVQITDVSGDGVEEAVVLYTAPNMGGNVRLALLSQNEEGWHMDYDTEGFGTEVQKLVFANLDGSDEKRIIAGYTFSDSSEKIMSVYFVQDGQVKGVQSQSCQDFMVQDVTGDGIGDIILASLNSDNRHSVVQVLNPMNSGILTALASRQLSVPNAKVTNIAISKNDFTVRNAIVIDYTDTYFRTYTQAVYFDEYRLETVLSPDVVQKRWVYDYSLKSMDVDADGYLETPTVINMENLLPENLKFMEWTNFLKPEPQRKYYGFCEANSGIYFPLPDEWQNIVTLGYGTSDDVWLVKSAIDEKILVRVHLLSPGYSQEISNDSTIVSVGVFQLEIIFDEKVTPQQREYICNGLMYIK